MAITLVEYPAATTHAAILALGDHDALVPNKMWQRHPGTDRGEVRLKVTSTASDTVHAQIINAGDNSVVQVRDALGALQNWTSLGAIGVETKVMPFDRVPCGGPYKVRLSLNGGSTTALTSSVQFSVGINGIVVGQSNARNLLIHYQWPEIPVWPAAANADCWLYDNQTSGHTLTSGWSQPAAGTCPLTETLNYINNATGFPASLTHWVRGAVGSNFFLPSPEGTWDDDSTYPAGQQLIDAYGRDFEYIIWYQGESDTNSSWWFNNATSNTLDVLEDYASRLNRIHQQFADYIGRSVRDVPMFPVAIASYDPTVTTLSTSGYDSPGPNRVFVGVGMVNDHILSVNRRFPSIRAAVTTMGEKMVDNIHITQEASRRTAKRLGHVVTSALGYTQGDSPRVSHAEIIDATTTDVYILHGAGTDFTGRTGTTGLTGWEVYNGNTGQWLSCTGAKVNATTVRLTHAAIPTASSRRVAYAATGGGTGANPIWDNSIVEFPLMPTPLMGIECKHTHRVCVPQYVGSYTANQVAGAGVGVYPYPYQWAQSKSLGKWQKPKRLLHILVSDSGELGLTGSYPKITITPNRGRPVVATTKLAWRTARVCYYQAELSGFATEILSVTGTREDGTSSSNFGMCIFQTPKSDLATLEPVSFLVTASTDTADMEITHDTGALSAHNLVLGLIAHSGGTTVSEEETPGLATSDSQWNQFNGAPYQNAHIAIARWDVAAASGDVIRKTHYDSNGVQQPMFKPTIATVVLESKYTAVALPDQSHNGGRVQLNVGYNADDMGSLLLNRIRAPSAGWYAVTVGYNIRNTRNNIGADGWPISGTVSYFYLLDKPSVRPGKYIFRLKGTATVNFSNVSLVESWSGSPSITGSQASGSNFAVKITPLHTSDSPSLNVTVTNPSDLPWDLELFYETKEALVDAGEIYDDEKIEVARSFLPEALRFYTVCPGTYDLFDGGAKFEHMKSPMYSVWGERDYAKNFYPGIATKSGSVYSVTLSGFEFTHGSAVMLDPDVTGGTELNVNGAGAKTLKNRSGESAYTVSGACVALWDEYLDCFLCSPSNDAVLQNMYPLEAYVELCNLLRTNVWWNYPTMATDPATDMIEGVAGFFAHNLDPWLKFKYQLGNENWHDWNGIDYFTGRFYRVRGETRYGNTSLNSATAGMMRAHALAGQKVAAQFGNDRRRFNHIHDCFLDAEHTSSANNDAAIAAMVNEKHLNPLKGISTGADARNWTFSTTVDGLPPATQFVSHIAYTSYWCPAYLNIRFLNLASLQNTYPNADDSWYATMMQDLYDHAAAWEAGNAAAAQPIEARALVGPGETVATDGGLEFDGRAHGVYATEAAASGLGALDYEGGPFMDVALGSSDYSVPIESITRGTTTVITVGAATPVVPPAGWYVTVHGLYGASITIDTGGTGWKVVGNTPSGTIKLVNTAGTRYMYGALTNGPAPAAGTTVGVTATAGLAEMNDYSPSYGAFQRCKVLSSSGRDITVELDSSGFSAPVTPPGSTTYGTMTFPSFYEIDSVDGTTTPGQTVYTLKAGMPMIPSTSGGCPRVIGPWAMQDASFYNNGCTQGAYVISVDVENRKITVAQNTSAFTAYSGSGAYLSYYGYKLYLQNLCSQIKYREPLAREYMEAMLNAVWDAGVIPSNLFIRDHYGAHGLFSLGSSGVASISDWLDTSAVQTPITLGLNDFNGGTPSAPTITGITPVPTSGTAPLTVNVIGSVSNYTTTVWYKRKGYEAWEQFATNTLTPTLSNMDVGVWSLRLEATNAAGTSTLTSTFCINIRRTSSGTFTDEDGNSLTTEN